MDDMDKFLVLTVAVVIMAMIGFGYMVHHDLESTKIDDPRTGEDVILGRKASPPPRPVLTDKEIAEVKAKAEEQRKQAEAAQLLKEMADRERSEALHKERIAVFKQQQPQPKPIIAAPVTVAPQPMKKELDTIDYENRIWTLKSGSKAEAKYVRYDAKTRLVSIKREDGKVAAIELTRFSMADRKYITGVLREIRRRKRSEAANSPESIRKKHIRAMRTARARQSAAAQNARIGATKTVHRAAGLGNSRIRLNQVGRRIANP